MKSSSRRKALTARPGMRSALCARRRCTVRRRTPLPQAELRSDRRGGVQARGGKKMAAGELTAWIGVARSVILEAMENAMELHEAAVMQDHLDTTFLRGERKEHVIR